MDPCGWLSSLGLHLPVALALAVPANEDPFGYVSKLSDADIEAKLRDAKLEGLLPTLKVGLAKLRVQQAADAAALNSKFALDGSVALAYGELKVFEGGLEASIGLPGVSEEGEALRARVTAVLGEAVAAARGARTLLARMHVEHCMSADSDVPYPSQKGDEIVKPRAQFQYVMQPPSIGYHLGSRCAKSGSEPIYGVRYALERKEAEFSKGGDTRSRLLCRLLSRLGLRHRRQWLNDAVGGRC